MNTTTQNLCKLSFNTTINADVNGNSTVHLTMNNQVSPKMQTLMMDALNTPADIRDKGIEATMAGEVTVFDNETNLEAMSIIFDIVGKFQKLMALKPPEGVKLQHVSIIKTVRVK